MKRFTVSALAAAAMAGSALLAPLAAQTYNDDPMNTNRGYGYQQNRSDYDSNPGQRAPYGQQRSRQGDNYGQNGSARNRGPNAYGQSNNYGQDNYDQGRYTYGQRNWSGNGQSQNQSNPSYGQDNRGAFNRGDNYNYGRSGDYDQSGRNQQGYRSQGANRFNNPPYNNGGYGAGRNAAPNLNNRNNLNDDQD